MSYANAFNRPAWYAEGLRWIGSLFIGAGNAIDSARGPETDPLEPFTPANSIDDYLTDVRFRINTRQL